MCGHFTRGVEYVSVVERAKVHALGGRQRMLYEREEGAK